MDIAPAGVISSWPRMLPVLVPMAPSSTITVEDRTEARTRSTAGSNAGDVETDPTLRYNALWSHGNAAFTIAYTPRILLGDFTGQQHEFQILDGGVAALTLVHKRTTFQINTFDQYGTIFASSLVIPTRWKGEGAPAIIYSLPATFTLPTGKNTKLTYVASYSNATLTQALTPRLNLTFNAQMGVFGGPDQVSKQQLPLVYGPNGEVKLEYRATRHDEVGGTVGVHYAETVLADHVPVYGANGQQELVNGQLVTQQSIQPQAAIVGYAEARYRHHWSKMTLTELAAGVAVANQSFPTEDQVGPYASRSSTIPYPTGELLTVYNPVDPEDHPRDKIQGVFDAKIEPWFSPFGGINEERVELASAVNFLVGKTTVRVQGAFYTVLPTGDLPDFSQRVTPQTVVSSGTPGKYTFAMAEVVVERKLTKYVTVDGGFRAFRQFFREDSLNGPPGTLAAQGEYTAKLVEYVGFVGLAWQTKPAKF